jgi:ACS family tartrate transporter-like MFS transporter
MSTIVPSQLQGMEGMEPGESTGRAALRKANRHLLPLLALGYGVAFIDRANVSYAALQMNHDLHFSASVYGLGAGLFFIGYSACEIPSNLLLVRFGAKRWLARIMFTWGLLAVAMMFVKTPVQFYAVRFVLGMAEAGFFPGVIFYLTQWFPAEERARAISRFYVSIPLSGAVMGLVAGALLNLQGRLGLAGWQWLFLLEGLPAVLLGVVFLLRLPNSPREAEWLEPAERDWILERLAREDSAKTGHGGNWLMVLRDVRFWQVAGFFLCMLTSTYALQFSAPTILKDVTNWSATSVGFVLSGINLLAAAAMILNALHSDRMKERFLHTGIPFLVVSLGFLMAGISKSAWMVVPAIAMIITACFSTMGPQWVIPSAFLRGEHAAASLAAMNTVGMLGGFIGPYWMGIARDLTGNYQRGLLTLTAPSLACVGIMLAMRRSVRGAR